MRGSPDQKLIPYKGLKFRVQEFAEVVVEFVEDKPGVHAHGFTRARDSAINNDMSTQELIIKEVEKLKQSPPSRSGYCPGTCITTHLIPTNPCTD
jgi:hypothetical protein